MRDIEAGHARFFLDAKMGSRLVGFRLGGKPFWARKVPELGAD